MYENLNSTKNTERNENQINLINTLTDLKTEIKNMFDNKKRIGQPEKVVDIEKVLGFNKRYQKE